MRINLLAYIVHVNEISVAGQFNRMLQNIYFAKSVKWTLNILQEVRYC